jgi:probable rRNA maturation factor
VRRALAAAADFAPSRPGEVSVLLASNEEIRELNRKWRGQDKATNVLSFPASPSPHAGLPGGPPPVLGDIALAFETIADEAERDRKSFPDHLAHLVVHGYLHILGYDHESVAEAEIMERLEADILGGLGIADPYSRLNGA